MGQVANNRSNGPNGNTQQWPFQPIKVVASNSRGRVETPRNQKAYQGELLALEIELRALQAGDRVQLRVVRGQQHL